MHHYLSLIALSNMEKQRASIFFLVSLLSLFFHSTYSTTHHAILSKTLIVRAPTYLLLYINILTKWQPKPRLQSRYEHVATQHIPNSMCIQCSHIAIQASSRLENFKMGDSPAKNISFDPVDKENVPANIPAPVMDDLELKKPLVQVYDAKKEVMPVVAPTIKPDEANEPLLQENPHRFVLFPIKYHEVRVYPTIHASKGFISLWLTPVIDTDMADVQESRSLLLDRRRNRPLQRPPRLEQPTQRR